MPQKFKNKNKNIAGILIRQQMHLIEKILLFITTAPRTNPKCKQSRRRKTQKIAIVTI